MSLLANKDFLDILEGGFFVGIGVADDGHLPGIGFTRFIFVLPSII